MNCDIYNANKSIINPANGAQLANHDNSTSPTNATLSNTAAGYATLGGRFAFDVPAGGATDYALFGFQVPAGLKLKITEIAINAVVATVLGASAVVLDWSLGLNGTAVSLATASVRRLPIGVQSFIATAAVGVAGQEIRRHFEQPLIARSGTFVHVIVQIPSGTSGNIRGDVMIDGYFEPEMV